MINQENDKPQKIAGKMDNIYYSNNYSFMGNSSIGKLR